MFCLRQESIEIGLWRMRIDFLFQAHCQRGTSSSLFGQVVEDIVKRPRCKALSRKEDTDMNEGIKCSACKAVNGYHQADTCIRNLQIQLEEQAKELEAARHNGNSAVEYLTKELEQANRERLDWKRWLEQTEQQVTALREALGWAHDAIWTASRKEEEQSLDDWLNHECSWVDRFTGFQESMDRALAATSSPALEEECGTCSNNCCSTHPTDHPYTLSYGHVACPRNTSKPPASETEEVEVVVANPLRHILKIEVSSAQLRALQEKAKGLGVFKMLGEVIEDMTGEAGAAPTNDPGETGHDSQCERTPQPDDTFERLAICQCAERAGETGTVCPCIKALELSMCLFCKSRGMHVKCKTIGCVDGRIEKVTP